MSYASLDRYREMEVMAMPPARRLVLLYSHLLLSLRQARQHMERGEIESRTERLLHAEALVRELALSLDRDQGGALAARLGELYAWILGQIALLHGKPDLGRLDAVLRIVADLYEAWDTAARQVAAAPASR